MDEWRSGLRARLAQVLTGLTDGLVERETQARLALLGRSSAGLSQSLEKLRQIRQVLAGR